MDSDSKDQRILKAFGKSLRVMRNNLGVSQEELAALAGVHRTYIGMIERGEKNITLLSLLKLSEALGLKVAELLEGLEDGQWT